MIRTPKEIEEEIAKLEIELNASRVAHGLSPITPDLLIKKEDAKYFPGKRYYDNHIQKLVWEEDD